MVNDFTREKQTIQNIRNYDKIMHMLEKFTVGENTLQTKSQR